MPQLTAYRAVYTDPSGLFPDLSEAVNFVECHIQLWFNCFDGSVDLVKFTPPLCERRTSLEHLVTPNLQDLRINGHIGRILPFLQGIPSLTTVAIDFASDSLPAQRALISALTIRPGDTGAHPGGLCPILVSFHGPIARIP
jgi:hypothetical protein